MSSPKSDPIPCDTCNSKHWTPREVLACQTFGPAPTFQRVEPITERQLWYIKEHLNGDATYAAKLSKQEASDYITRLKRDRYYANQAASAKTPEPAPQVAPVSYKPPVWEDQMQTPYAMVEQTRSGRYAVRHDENEPFKFVRITRPTRGRKAGCTIIQSQHSERFKDCVIVFPSGRVTVLDRRVDPFLLLTVADPMTAARNYATELGRCCQCGKELTDGRSIWFGIGPECEKSWPEIIERVLDEKGDYQL